MVLAADRLVGVHCAERRVRWDSSGECDGKRKRCSGTSGVSKTRSKMMQCSSMLILSDNDGGKMH